MPKSVIGVFLMKLKICPFMPERHEIKLAEWSVQRVSGVNLIWFNVFRCHDLVDEDLQVVKTAHFPTVQTSSTLSQLGVKVSPILIIIITPLDSFYSSFPYPFYYKKGLYDLKMSPFHWKRSGLCIYTLEIGASTFYDGNHQGRKSAPFKNEKRRGNLLTRNPFQVSGCNDCLDNLL